MRILMDNVEQVINEKEYGSLEFLLSQLLKVIETKGRVVTSVKIDGVNLDSLSVLSMEEIEDCLAYGEKNLITGQNVVCDVVLHEPKENIKKIIRLFCKDKLDAFKIPTKVNVVEKTNFSERFKKIRIK